MKENFTFTHRLSLGDGTSAYTLNFREGSTVSDFVEFLKQMPDEHGNVVITKGDRIVLRTDHEHGLISECVPSEYADMPIVKADTNGGWSRMDYFIQV